MDTVKFESDENYVKLWRPISHRGIATGAHLPTHRHSLSSGQMSGRIPSPSLSRMAVLGVAH